MEIGERIFIFERRGHRRFQTKLLKATLSKLK